MAQDYEYGIPFSPETAEEFFEQIDEWNKEDRYADCIRELEKALSIAGEEHAYRVAYLFARACQNAVYHDDSFPDEQKDILMQWTLSALDGVWDEGIDIPEWNMRIAFAFEYTGELGLAVRYAKRWLRLDPENEDAVRAVETFLEEAEAAEHEEAESEDDGKEEGEDEGFCSEPEEEDDVPKNSQGEDFHLDTCVLLDDPYLNQDSYLRTLKRSWGLDAAEIGDRQEGELLFYLPGCLVSIKLKDRPVSDKMMKLAALHNTAWKDGSDAAKRHNSHFLVSLVSQGASPFECKETFIKLLSVFGWYENVCAIFDNYVLYEPGWYRREAEKLRGDGMASLLMIWVFLLPEKDGLTGYTCGMDAFDREELEMVRIKAPMEEARRFLARFAAGSLLGDPLEEGTYTFSGHKCVLTRSAAMRVPAETSLKVSYS